MGNFFSKNEKEGEKSKVIKYNFIFFSKKPLSC